MKTTKLNYCILCCMGGLLLLLAGCGDKDETSYTLNGRLSNLETPYIYMVTEINDSILFDTIRVDKNGGFSYKSQAEHLSIASLFFDGKAQAATVFIKNGWDIRIEGDVSTPQSIYATGGTENDDLTAFKKENKLLDKNELTNKIRQYVENNTNKIAGVVLVRDLLKNDTTTAPSRADSLLNMFTGEAATFPPTIELKNYSAQLKLSQTEAKAPEFILKNEEKELKSQDYKDKYVLINVFLAQKDSLKVSDFILKTEDYQRLKDKNVEFLSIILCNRPNLYIPDSIKWDVFCEPKSWASPFVKMYNIGKTPYNVLISPTGMILEQGVSPTPLIGKIESQIADGK